MQEEIFISGRNLPKIDPYLEVWHFPISLYLFLGGMAAGIIFFASLFTILKREKQVQTAIKTAMIIVLFALSIGLIALLRISFMSGVFIPLSELNHQCHGAPGFYSLSQLARFYGFSVILPSYSLNGTLK